MNPLDAWPDTIVVNALSSSAAPLGPFSSRTMASIGAPQVIDSVTAWSIVTQPARCIAPQNVPDCPAPDRKLRCGAFFRKNVSAFMLLAGRLSQP